MTEGYGLVSEPSFDTNWCEPHDHATHNQDWDTISGSRNRSDRNVTQWKPAPDTTLLEWVEWCHEAT
jgi:hypothetical protein